MTQRGFKQDDSIARRQPKITLRWRIGEWAKVMGRLFLANGNTVRGAAQMPIVERLLPQEDLGRCLDVGCGGGMYMLETLASRSSWVGGIDFDRKHVELTQWRLCAKRLSKAFVAQASAEMLPFADQSFDTLLCIEVIEHLAARQDALREMWRVLRPHGKLLVSVPLLPPPFYHLDHVVQGFSREEILHELELAGFSIIKEDVALLRWSRWVLRMCHRTGLPLPLLFICHLENRVFSKRSNRIEQKPLDILLLVQKSDLVQ